jgi:hypothetical protein
MDWRVFWRIIFDVLDSSPRLQLEMTLWKLSPLNRLGRLVIDLTPGMSTVGTVFFVDSKAIFVGGYLECELDLNRHARDLLSMAGIDVDDEANWENVSRSINGENVSIETEVALFDLKPEPDYPIFYFPQRDSRTGVRLLESVTQTGNRRVVWEISDQTMNSNPSFSLEKFEGQHRVRVRQGLDRDEKSIFNFLVDSIPAGTGRTDPDHRFTGEPQTFYIGATPDHRGFVGEITRLDFDPNNSCIACLAFIKPDEDKYNDQR